MRNGGEGATPAPSTVPGEQTLSAIKLSLQDGEPLLAAMALR